MRAALSCVLLLAPAVVLAQQPAAAAHIQVQEDRIQLLEPVQFVDGKTALDPASLPLLDEVAAALLERPNITRVRVEGHTDNQGAKAANDKLSKARADAVKKYLQSKGVPAKVLESAGLGPARPRYSNETEEGRALNHRVEVAIVQLDGKPVVVAVGRVVGVDGDLQTTASDKEPWASAAVDTRLVDSQWVATGPDSAGRLLMRDSGVTQLEADSLALVRGSAAPDAKRPPTQVVLYKGAARTLMADPKGPQGAVTLRAGALQVDAAQSEVEVRLLEDGGAVVIHRGGAPVMAKGKTGKPVTLTADQKLKMSKEGVLGVVQPMPPFPAWDSDAPVVAVAIPGSPANPSGGLAAGNEAVNWKGRLAQHPEGEPVLGTIEGTGTPVKVDGLKAGLWQVRLRAVDAEGDEGPMGPPRLFRVIGVDVPEARAGRPVAFTQGRMLTMPEGVTVARNDGTPAASILLDEPGEATLKVFPAADAAPVELAVNVVPVKAQVLGDGKVMEGSDRQFTVELLGAGLMPQPWEVKDVVGVDVLRNEAARPTSLKTQTITVHVRGKTEGPATITLGPPGDSKTRTTLEITVVPKPKPVEVAKAKKVERPKYGWFNPPALVLASLGAVAGLAGVLLSPLVVVGAVGLAATRQPWSMAVLGVGVAGMATLTWAALLAASAVVHWVWAF